MTSKSPPWRGILVLVVGASLLTLFLESQGVGPWASLLGSVAFTCIVVGAAAGADR